MPTIIKLAKYIRIVIRRKHSKNWGTQMDICVDTSN